MKKCFKCCKEKSLEKFYRHSGMKDGRLNKCMDCSKKDVYENRIKNIEYYRKYDRDRGNRQDAKYFKEYRDKFPNKYRATNMINNAIRDGKLFKEPCVNCGSDKNLHAHHDDYSKPLNIRWLCAVCHKQWHAENGEGTNY